MEIRIHIIHEATREYLRTEAWTPPNEWTALPANATTVELPPVRAGQARVLTLTCDAWAYAEDHRGKSGYVNGEAHTIAQLGPIPQGWSETAPEVTLDTLQAAKRAAISAAHESALAGVVAIADPTPTVVAIEAALLAITDEEGLSYARQKLAERKAELLVMVAAATTAADIEAIAVTYPV